MSSSQLLDFIRALKSDPKLKERVIRAQHEGMTNIHHQADAIVALARNAGFDLGEWAERPTDVAPDSRAGGEDTDCRFTCCLVATSTT